MGGRMNRDIEQIRNTLDLVLMAESAGTELNYKYGEWRGCCPLHRGDNKGGFAIYEKDGRLRWQCFSGDCGGGDGFAFLMALNKQSFAQVLDDLEKGKQPAQPVKPDDTERRLRELERKVKEQERRLSELEKWKQSEPWQQYHDNAPELARQAWRQAGVPDEWQNFYRLGGTQSFTYSSDNNYYTSPTLTIPVYAQGWKCQTVRHRILNPVDPSDKYRPDIPGLGSHPFLADPDLGFDVAGRTIVVEGEKKAIVTFLTLDTPLVQVIGLPGKAIWKQVAQELKGQDVSIILDPDAEKEAVQMAQKIGGAKVVRLKQKIDDVIVKHGCDRDWINGLLQTGRMVKA